MNFVHERIILYNTTTYYKSERNYDLYTTAKYYNYINYNG